METKTSKDVMNYAAQYVDGISKTPKEYEYRMMSIAKALTSDDDEAGSLYHELKLEKVTDDKITKDFLDGLDELSEKITKTLPDEPMTL